MDSLPPILRRYLDRVLALAPPAGTTVRVRQQGEMVLKPGARPRGFTATEEFAIDRVGFEWRARFPFFGPLSFRVTDRYRQGEVLLAIRLLALPLQRRRGPAIAQGEAYRYLAELPWAPHAIAANTELTWNRLDGSVVEVATLVGGERIAVRLRFNQRGEIARAEAERPRAEAGGAIVPWIREFHDYTLIGGVLVPSRGQVLWDLPEGPFIYWRGRVTSLEVLG